MTVRIDHRITAGTFSLDGGTWDVENNVWLVGNDEECVLIDAPHDADAILAAVDGRHLRAIVCTHAHDDHVNVAPAVAEVTGAPILLHVADRVLWDMVHPEREPDSYLADGMTIDIAGSALHVLHTPGHAPGAVCLYLPSNRVVFSGDTLFHGGPGATGRSYSDFDTIIDSIRTKLLTLPPETIVHTGHGDDTTIGAEAPHLDEWLVRGN
jgi:glyoxylase-like metal-dependent hydrolase (beta-lactamase superfamily II)